MCPQLHRTGVLKQTCFIWGVCGLGQSACQDGGEAKGILGSENNVSPSAEDA